LGTIITLSSLFAVDAFAGAFIVQSFLSYYYEMKYELYFDKIGGVLFACNIVSGISGVLSSKLVDRIGAMATMIYTHLPSNVFLLFIAFTNNPTISIILLFARFCISQMDVPARQTYVTMVVSSEERSAANGITNIARSVGLVFGLGLNGYFMGQDVSSPQFSYPFLIAGGLKIVYDITIGCLFLWNKKAKQDEEKLKLASTELVETPSIQSEQEAK
jgi:MFS family permease